MSLADQIVYGGEGPLIPMSETQFDRVLAERRRVGRVLTREEALAIVADEALS